MLEESPGSEGNRWYSGIPLPEVESLEPSSHAHVEAEDAESFHGVRLSLLAAAVTRRQPCPRSFMNGTQHSRLATRCLAEMNGSLMSLESSLVNEARNGFDEYECEGPKNRDIQLKAMTTEGKELLQTKMIPC